MSDAPQSLIDLRQFLAEHLDVPRANFGIRGEVTSSRSQGYHLGEAEIFGPDGQGLEDYSLRYKRDRRGLTDASAGFDGKVPQQKLRAITAYMVGAARSGQTNPGGPALIVEVHGPDANGAAKRWARDTDWLPTPSKPKHEWHFHVSFYRDTEFIDKRPMFFGFFGIVALDDQQGEANEEMTEDAPQ